MTLVLQCKVEAYTYSLYLFHSDYAFIDMPLSPYAVPPSVLVVSADESQKTPEKGDTVVLRFAITRASPLVELMDIVWMHNGTRLNITFLELQGRYNFSDDLQMLTISDVQVSDEGEFTLGASNPAGFDSATTDLTVYGKVFGF